MQEGRGSISEISQNSSVVCLLFKEGQDRLCKVFHNVIFPIATIAFLGLMWSNGLVPRTSLNDVRLSLWKGSIASAFQGFSCA